MRREPAEPAVESLRALLGGAAGRLKIFPLPDVVVFPGAPAPLHIFEPRYRAMTEAALSGDRLMAVATLRDPGQASQPRAPLHPIAGACFVEADERLPDGRYNLLLRGVSRVRLVEEITGTGLPYREFRVEVLDDAYPPGGPAALATKVSTLDQFLLELARRSAADAGERDLAEAAARMRVPGRLADSVAAALVADTDERLDLLEETDVGRRLDRVIDAVGTLLLTEPAEGGPAPARA